MHERQAIKKRVKSLLEGIWLSFYCYPATTGYLFLIISDQQFIDRFSFLGYGTDGTEDADSLDMETGIEVVEEGVLRVLLPGSELESIHLAPVSPIPLQKFARLICSSSPKSCGM